MGGKLEIFFLAALQILMALFLLISDCMEYIEKILRKQDLKSNRLCLLSGFILLLFGCFVFQGKWKLLYIFSVFQSSKLSVLSFCELLL